jgi:glucose/arabinose dehydrogenase
MIKDMRTWITLAAVAGLLLFSTCKKNSSPNNNTPDTPGDDSELTDKVLTDKLTFPWEVLWGPDNKLWITERGGKISSIDPANGNITLIKTISEVVSRGEGGLAWHGFTPRFCHHPRSFCSL